MKLKRILIWLGTLLSLIALSAPAKSPTIGLDQIKPGPDRTALIMWKGQWTPILLPDEISINAAGKLVIAFPAPAPPAAQPIWVELALDPAQAPAWTLPDTPIAGSLELQRNGLGQLIGAGYTLAGNTLTLVPSSGSYAPDDLWRVRYQKSQ